MVQYDSTYKDKEWLHRSLVGKILPNADVATMEETILKSIDKAVSFRLLGASQSWGNIIGYDTSCVSQGSISGIRVLIKTTKLEPLQGQVLLKLDGIQVEVSLIEIKRKYIPSLITVKHFMDISLYTTTVLSDDDEDDQGDVTMRTTSSHRATGQHVEFEFDPIDTLGNNTLIDSAFSEHVMPPIYLYPEIIEPCKQAVLAKKSMYEVDNYSALVRYDYAKVVAADYRAVDGQHAFYLSEGEELDQERGYTSGEPKKTGQKQKQKQSIKGLVAKATLINFGPSFTNFINPIADPSELCNLELRNKKSQKHKAKRLTRRTRSLSRRKSRKMENHIPKQSETVIIEYSVSDNGIKNINAIIYSRKELADTNEASSSFYRSSSISGA
ncbi:hypothetical protein POTOM_060305 [Populus tomentosa]|uniref:Uncharacterized protein n=1 Tax=Populus tomentosa TaxID=118781 RepID=A0A8X7XS60_POPTO|nr:hypothetical protein POTOM_060305 [Populus tomentosa]